MKPIRQNDSTDCGAACLAMIADHFGYHTSLTEMRAVTGTDRSGVTLQGLVDGATHIGLEAQPVRSDTKNIDKDVPLPSIAHVVQKTEPHFVVIVHIGKRRLTVFDPAIGKVRVTKAAFVEEWTGYLVVVRPGPTFIRSLDSGGLLWRFLPFLKPHRSMVFHTVLASLVLTILGIISALYYRFLVDDVLSAGSKVTLHVTTIGVLVVALSQVLLSAIRSRMLLSFAVAFDLSLSLSFFRRVLRLPLSFFDSRKTGEVLSRLDDTQHVQDALSEAAFTILFDTFMVVVVGAALVVFNWRLFIIAAVTVPLSSVVVWSFAAAFRRTYREQLVNEDSLDALLVETVSGVATIKAQTAEQEIFRRVERQQVTATRPAWRSGRLGVIQSGLVAFIQSWGGYAVFWVGGLLIIDGRLSLGELISFNVLLGYFVGPLSNLINLQPALQQALVAARRLTELWDLSPESEDSEALLRSFPVNGDIRFSSVMFRYGSRRPVLNDLDLFLPGGSACGIVGESGSGKSTMIKLLLKFYQPREGRVTIGGVDIRDIDTGTLRRQIGYVSQSTFLFHGTIRENIALGQPLSSMDAIISATTRAGAHEFIDHLPDRYETVLSEQGLSLSGGERQRLAIARALLRNPKILVLDEATSQLDAILEHSLISTLESLQREGLTLIVASHRLSTVRFCDLIVMLQDGRAAESGRHGELMAANGLYARLWKAFAG
jgi:ATP-binding cassette subfamily B protein